MMPTIVLQFLLLFLLNTLAGAAFSSSASARNNHKQSMNTYSTINLPIFPLRKKVRLPTEQLTLNLYEERYLELAQYVLQDKHKICGALYASDQPQMVTQGGMGPIVPMVTPGQIGVVCWVHDYSVANIPTVGGELQRRRIRLNLIATQRFEVQRILHNGYGGGYALDEKNETPLPFILAEAKLILDSNERIDKEHDHWMDPLLEQYQSQTREAGTQPMPSNAELRGFRLAAQKLEEAASQKRLACLHGRSSVARLKQFR